MCMYDACMDSMIWCRMPCMKIKINHAGQSLTMYVCMCLCCVLVCVHTFVLIFLCWLWYVLHHQLRMCLCMHVCSVCACNFCRVFFIANIEETWVLDNEQRTKSVKKPCGPWPLMLFVAGKHAHSTHNELDKKVMQTSSRLCFVMLIHENQMRPLHKMITTRKWYRYFSVNDSGILTSSALSCLLVKKKLCNLTTFGCRRVRIMKSSRLANRVSCITRLTATTFPLSSLCVCMCACVYVHLACMHAVWRYVHASSGLCAWLHQDLLCPTWMYVCTYVC